MVGNTIERRKVTPSAAKMISLSAVVVLGVVKDERNR